jgi:cobalt/nickel transport system permease protein
MATADLLDRTLGALAANVRWFLLVEDVPRRRGFLQAVSPGVKLVGVFGLVALAASRTTLPVVVALVALSAVLAATSLVPPRAFLGRLAGPPALAFVVVAPQLVLMGGPSHPVVPLSFAGVEYVATFTVRVAACVGFLSLLLLTTRFADLLAAVRRLRAPPLAVSLLAITHRYLLVSFAELGRMVRARRGRTIEDPDLRHTWRDSGHFLGTFFLRSLERGEAVQRAARARGGPGVTPVERRQSLGPADAAFGGIVVATVAVVLVGGFA